jgi:hypothetical protein
MRHVHRTMVLMMLACAGSAAADPCLLTPAELHATTGREFEAGTPGQDIVTQEPHCTYRETKNAKRHVMVRILTQKAPKRFEASKRTVHFGKDPIDLEGVGEAAFYSGTTAGVLLGEQAIILSTLRRASDPKIDRAVVADLLRKAAERLKLL